MYDQNTFRSAKHDLIYANLQQALGLVKQAKLGFLRRILRTAAINGEVEEIDVEYAVKYSIVHNCYMTQDEINECLSWMNYHGKRYVGQLSREQQQVLQLLQELCERVTDEGDLSALQRIAELI